MSEDSKVVRLRQPEEIDDPLTAILRAGARRLLEQAIEAEVDAFLAAMKDVKLPDGRDRVVRHGHGPERTIQTGIGAVAVRRAKVRDRGGDAAGERVRFTSAILPRWARRSKSLDALLPVLYLRGVSTGDFQEALSALLGKDAPNLSASVIGRLKEEWAADYARWQRRDLSARRYVYIWADGVYLQARMEPAAECMLVIIGATPEGRKELVGFQVGVRESAQSWRELLVDIQARGLAIAPELAVADGALGFWKALEEVFPTTRHQRCWVHKTANVLNKVAKTVQPAMKQDLREIWMAPDRAAAQVALDVFVRKYVSKYAKAVECLTKDRDALLAFYDFPAEHWDHIRTSNPIESVFATVRHRTFRTKGALSQDTAKLMVFKLVTAAAKTWRRLQGENLLPKLIRGVTFRDGIEVTDYGMEGTRNNPGVANENGSIEVSHAHLKRRIDQALRRRHSRDFASLDEYRRFLARLVDRHNTRRRALVIAERAVLRRLPEHRAADFAELTVPVTRNSTISVDKVLYTVPSRLIGHKLKIHLHDDRLEGFLGATSVITLERGRASGNHRGHVIDFHHVIGTLKRKPQALRHLIYRDALFPRPVYRQVWEALDAELPARHACRVMVGLLDLAADGGESALAERLEEILAAGDLPDLKALTATLRPKQPAVTDVAIRPPDAAGYDVLLPIAAALEMPA